MFLPPLLPLRLVFVHGLPNCISVSLQHIKLCASLCFLNPSVLHDPLRCHGVPHCLLPAHHFPPILPFAFCFLSFNFSPFFTNWQEQASVKPAWTETAADSCSYHSATEATWVCTQGMFPEHTKSGSSWSRSYPLDSQLSHIPGDSAFPIAKSLILFQVHFYCYRTAWVVSALHLSHSTPVPLYTISEATFLATSNLFSSTWLLTPSFCYQAAFHKLSSLLSLPSAQLLFLPLF